MHLVDHTEGVEASQGGVVPTGTLHVVEPDLVEHHPLLGVILQSEVQIVRVGWQPSVFAFVSQHMLEFEAGRHAMVGTCVAMVRVWLKHSGVRLH